MLWSQPIDLYVLYMAHIVTSMFSSRTTRPNISKTLRFYFIYAQYDTNCGIFHFRWLHLLKSWLFDITTFGNQFFVFIFFFLYFNMTLFFCIVWTVDTRHITNWLISEWESVLLMFVLTDIIEMSQSDKAKEGINGKKRKPMTHLGIFFWTRVLLWGW